MPMKKIAVWCIVSCILLCGCGKVPDVVDSGAVQKENAWNVYTYSKTVNGFRSTMYDYPVTDENELKELLEKAGSDLKLPSYIPDGYIFESANLSYYLTKEMLDGLSAEEKETEDGNMEYQYMLPDDVLTQIDGFDITYKNENGEEIFIDADYVESMEMSTDGIDSFQNIEMVNYEVSRTGTLYEKYMGEFFRRASPICEYNGKDEKTLNCIFVRISISDTEENEQMIKIAESM